MPDRILVAIDGSDGSRGALDFAAAISAKIGGDLTILHVLLHGKPAEEMARLAEAEHIIRETAPRVLQQAGDLPRAMGDYLADLGAAQARAVAEIGDYLARSARDEAERAGARNVETEVRDGDVADVILDMADEIEADLIVLGRRGLGRVGQLFLGSVSSKVMQHAECSVLAVR